MQSLIKAKPSLLLYKDQFIGSHLKQERVSKGEVLAAIHSKGIGDVKRVDAVVLETDGSFRGVPDLQNSSALRDVHGLREQDSRVLAP